MRKYVLTGGSFALLAVVLGAFASNICLTMVVQTLTNTESETLEIIKLVREQHRMARQVLYQSRNLILMSQSFPGSGFGTAVRSR